MSLHDFLAITINICPVTKRWTIGYRKVSGGGPSNFWFYPERVLSKSVVWIKPKKKVGKIDPLRIQNTHTIPSFMENLHVPWRCESIPSPPSIALTWRFFLSKQGNQNKLQVSYSEVSTAINCCRHFFILFNRWMETDIPQEFRTIQYCSPVSLSFPQLESNKKLMMRCR
jgi:hypothetical protein